MPKSFVAGSSTLFNFLCLCSPTKGSQYMSSTLLCHSTIITDCHKLSKLALKFQACCNTSMTHMLVSMTANGVLSETSHRLSKAYFASQCHTVLWYTCKCNFIYAHDRNMTFPALIFSKLGHAYLPFSISPQSDGNNVGSENMPSLMPVNKDWLSMHQFFPNLMKILGMVPIALISTKL